MKKGTKENNNKKGYKIEKIEALNEEMPKVKKTGKKGEDIDDIDDIDIEDIDIEEVKEDVVESELDPELVKALNVKPQKKNKALSDTDYIPELERDLDDSDLGDDY